MAVLSFAAGLASLLLIERQQRVAQVMMVLLPLSWLLILGEGWFVRLAERRPRWRLSPLVLRYAMQALHQESLFFTLPFFLATTTWASGQAVFTGLMIAAAAASMIDPFYYGFLAARRWAYLGFHAMTVFITVITAAPMLWHLQSLETVKLAIACMAVLSIPSLLHVIDRTRWSHWLGLFMLVAGQGLLAWTLRGWIPPATLWLGEAVVSQEISVQEKTAVPIDVDLDTAAVHARGVYVFTAIRAPRGLRERVQHVWLHEGKEVDRVTLDIVGGREQGYRAWSHKRHFPADPRGQWRVRVVTAGGQLIGVVHFEVR